MKKIATKKLKSRIEKLENQVTELEEDKRLDFMVRLYSLDDKESKRHINRSYR
ncbi:hypothetical protein ES705_50424 [subsurface metagenome]